MLQCWASQKYKISIEEIKRKEAETILQRKFQRLRASSSRSGEELFRP